MATNATAHENTGATTQLREHPIENALFNSVGPITIVWLVIRLWLGYQWLQSGLSKVGSPEWMNGTKIVGFWNAAIADHTKPNPDVAYDWYAGFLKNLVDSHSQSWFAPLIA